MKMGFDSFHKSSGFWSNKTKKQRYIANRFEILHLNKSTNCQVTKADSDQFLLCKSQAIDESQKAESISEKPQTKKWESPWITILRIFTRNLADPLKDLQPQISNMEKPRIVGW